MNAALTVLLRFRTTFNTVLRADFMFIHGTMKLVTPNDFLLNFMIILMTWII